MNSCQHIPLCSFFLPQPVWISVFHKTSILNYYSHFCVSHKFRLFLQDVSKQSQYKLIIMKKKDSELIFNFFCNIIMVAVTFLSANFDSFPYNYKLISHNSDLFFLRIVRRRKRRRKKKNRTVRKYSNYDKKLWHNGLFPIIRTIIHFIILWNFIWNELVKLVSITF